MGDKKEDADSLLHHTSCTNFKILDAVVPEKPLTQIFFFDTHFVGVRDGKRNKIKRRQNKFHHSFLIYNILPASVGVYKI